MWAHPVFIAKCARERWGTPTFKTVTPSLIIIVLDYYIRKTKIPIFTSNCNIIFKSRLENLGTGTNLEKIPKEKQMLKKIVLISILLENFSKINKRPGPNKDVQGGKLSKNNKNVQDYY